MVTVGGTLWISMDNYRYGILIYTLCVAYYTCIYRHSTNHVYLSMDKLV